MRRAALKALVFLAASYTNVDGFLVPRPRSFASTRLCAELPHIDKMKAGEMKKELESYGISTKSLFEKREFVDALKKARAEEKTVVDGSASGSSSSTSSAKSSSTNTDSSSSASSASREKKYKEALGKAQKMKVKELKKELQSRGISTASFFEKSEFIKAYAEAMADNKSGSGPRPEEPRDPSYRDVVMQKMSKGSMMGDRVIDIMAR